MLPILYVTRDRQQAETYVSELVLSQKIPAYAVFHISPEKAVISIDQIRDVQSMTQRFKEPSLIAIYDFHTAKKETQNAFLKTLEEESNSAQFVMSVSDDVAVLPTIRSRSQVVYADRLDAKKGLLAAYGFDGPDVTCETWLSLTTQVSKEDAEDVIREVSAHVRKNMQQGKIAASSYLRAQQKLMDILQTMTKNNVNYEYSLDALGTVLSEEGLLPLS